jgi:hypothetical protein
LVSVESEAVKRNDVETSRKSVEAMGRALRDRFVKFHPRLHGFRGLWSGQCSHVVAIDLTSPCKP